MLEATEVGEVILAVTPQMHARLLIVFEADENEVVARWMVNATTHWFGRNGDWRASSDGEQCRLLAARPLNANEERQINEADHRLRSARDLDGLKLRTEEIALLLEIRRRYPELR